MTVWSDPEGDTADPATPDEPIRAESADHLREFVGVQEKSRLVSLIRRHA